MLWQNIEVLRLDQNQLGTLPVGILSPFHETLRVLVLSNNPITLLDPYIFLPLVRMLMTLGVTSHSVLRINDLSSGLTNSYPRFTHTTAPTPASPTPVLPHLHWKTT